MKICCCNINISEVNKLDISSTNVARSATEDRNITPLPIVACELDGYNSPIQKSNLLQFEYTSPEFPTSIQEHSSGLCVLRIDHNWKFAPRTNTSYANGTSTSLDDTDDSDYSSASDDDDFYEEFCGFNIEPIISEGEEESEGTTTGEEGGEGQQTSKPPRQKPKICQVTTEI